MKIDVDLNMDAELVQLALLYRAKQARREVMFKIISEQFDSLPAGRIRCKKLHEAISKRMNITWSWKSYRMLWDVLRKIGVKKKFHNGYRCYWGLAEK